MKPKKTTLYVGLIALVVCFILPQVGDWFLLIIFLCLLAAIAIAKFNFEYATYYNSPTAKVLFIVSDLVIVLLIYPLLHNKLHILNFYSNLLLVPLVFSVTYLTLTFARSIKFGKELWISWGK